MLVKIYGSSNDSRHDDEEPEESLDHPGGDKTALSHADQRNDNIKHSQTGTHDGSAGDNRANDGDNGKSYQICGLVQTTVSDIWTGGELVSNHDQDDREPDTGRIERYP